MNSFVDYLPFVDRKRGRPPKKAQLLDVNDQKGMVKLFKSMGLAMGFTGSTFIGKGRVNFEPAPYDFDRIIQAIDTDSYVKQAFNKYKELMWKEGWDIVSENTEARAYLWQRLSLMELSMQKTFDSLMVDIADQLVKFANAFVRKVRGDLQPYFPGKLYNVGGQEPIVGYELLPTETIEVMRDYRNKPILYRQNIWNTGNATGSGFSPAVRDNSLLPTWKPEEIIHFYVDRKSGRIFGTPFMVAVMDDVIALRQIEEDIQNLVHRELFPLYVYKIGDVEHPAEPGEIDEAADKLESMRTEGGLVVPERHEVDVLGSEHKALEASSYLDHFKQRLAVGLGLSPHHLGMGAANKAASDRLDISLYDKVKLYQKYFSGTVKLQIFSELLVEGGFDPYVVPESESVSDQCIFKFNEIDVDTQVKKENHIIQKYTSDLSETSEARIELGYKPEINEKEIYSAVSQRALPSPGKPITPSKASTSGNASNPSNGGAQNVPTKPDAAIPSTGGSTNPPNKNRKQVANIAKPINQFGRRLSPGIRHFDDSYLDDIVELIDDGVCDE